MFENNTSPLIPDWSDLPVGDYVEPKDANVDHAKGVDLDES